MIVHFSECTEYSRVPEKRPGNIIYPVFELGSIIVEYLTLSH